jgi:hypothetical protein
MKTTWHVLCAVFVLAVARQQVQIVRLRAAGRSTLDAEQTLGALTTTLAVFEEHEKALRSAQI